MNEVCFVGDIHACLQPLQEVLERTKDRARTYVFLGDYVSRGRDTKEVIELLIDLQRDPSVQTHFLHGNHDLELLNVLQGGPIAELLRMGGAPTVRSYVRSPTGDVARQLREAFPKEHMEFVLALSESYETSELFARHDRSPGASTRKYGIFGHTVQSHLLPLIESDHAFIDTGCGTRRGGRLTGFLWPSRDWEQSSPWDASDV